MRATYLSNLTSRLPALTAGLVLAVALSRLPGAPPEVNQRSEWTIETVAGNGKSGAFAKGDALACPVDQPFGVEQGPDGAWYITSVGQHQVLRYEPASGTISVVAGSGKKGFAGDGGPAAKADLNEPYEVRFDDDANMYFVEMQNHAVRRVDARTGTITTIAGTGQRGCSGDGGPATSATLADPHSIALDSTGKLFIADISNHRIREVDLESGTIRTLAGTGEPRMPADGDPAATSPFFGPRALAVTGRKLWVALREGNSVWRIDLDSGTLRHIAGSGETGHSGDGGDPRLARFNGPKGIAVTGDEVAYVVDTENQVIRKIDAKRNTIATIAGLGPSDRGFAVEKGLAALAKFDRPHGIGLGASGELFIGDTNNHRVRRLFQSSR